SPGSRQYIHAAMQRLLPGSKGGGFVPRGAGDEAGGHGGRQALQRGASPCLRTSAVAACAARCMQQEVCGSTTGIAAPRSALHRWHASAQPTQVRSAYPGYVCRVLPTTPVTDG